MPGKQLVMFKAFLAVRQRHQQPAFHGTHMQ